MEWFADFTRVTFGGIDNVFDVSSVFCEFNIGDKLFSIKWYGVIIAFGFILAALFGGRIAYTWRINLSKMVDVLIYGIRKRLASIINKPIPTRTPIHIFIII